MTQPTLKELLLMSDFGRLQAKREREQAEHRKAIENSGIFKEHPFWKKLAARGSSKSEPVKRSGDERDTKQPTR